MSYSKERQFSELPFLIDFLPAHGIIHSMSRSDSVDLSKLMAWYASHCDGLWEHDSRIKLTTIDNPGWLLRVNLAGTDLEHARFDEIIEDSENEGGPNGTPWIHCMIKDHQFIGACDQTQLPRLIDILNGLLESSVS